MISINQNPLKAFLSNSKNNNDLALLQTTENASSKFTTDILNLIMAKTKGNVNAVLQVLSSNVIVKKSNSTIPTESVGFDSSVGNTNITPDIRDGILTKKISLDDNAMDKDELASIPSG